MSGSAVLVAALALALGAVLGALAVGILSRRSHAQGASPSSAAPAPPLVPAAASTPDAARIAELETLVSVLGHDLREPLRTLRGFAELIERRCGHCAECPNPDMLKRVISGARRADRMVEDLAGLGSRWGERETPRPFSAEVIVGRVIEDLADAIEQSAARVAVIRPLPEIIASPRWAIVAIRNLVANAIRHSASGSPPEIEIRGLVASGAHGAGLVVADRGAGLPEAERENLFRLVHQGPHQPRVGLGVGLAIVAEIVRQHGGQIEVRDREGGGSEFIIRFGAAALHQPSS